MANQLTRILYLAQGEAVVDGRQVVLRAMSCDPPIAGPNPLGLFAVGGLLHPFHSNCGQQIVPFRGLNGHLPRDNDGMGAGFEGARVNNEVRGWF